MAQVNLGQVRDKITAITKTSTVGLVDTYKVITECSPEGAGTFEVHNGADGQDGTDGTNGKDGYKVSISSAIAGSGLATQINTIGIKNILAIMGCPAGSPVAAYEQYTWGGSLDASPDSTTVTLSNLVLYDKSGNSVDLSTKQFFLVYVDVGNTVASSFYNLGSNASLDALMSDAYDVYMSNGESNFGSMAAQYPHAIGIHAKAANNIAVVNIFPLACRKVASVTTVRFTVLDGYDSYEASSTDGTTWNYAHVNLQSAYNLGTQSTMDDAISAAYTYYAGSSADIEKHPYAMAVVNSTYAYLFPEHTGAESTFFFAIIYNGTTKRCTVKTSGGAYQSNVIEDCEYQINLGTLGGGGINTALSAIYNFCSNNNSWFQYVSFVAYPTSEGCFKGFVHFADLAHTSIQINYQCGEHIGYAVTTDGGSTWTKYEATLSTVA